MWGFFTKLIRVIRWPQVPFTPFMGWVWVTTVGWFAKEYSFWEENILNGSKKTTPILWSFVKSLPMGQCFVGLWKLYFPSGEFPTMQHMHKDFGDGGRDGFECLSSSLTSPALMNGRISKKMRLKKNIIFLIDFPQTSFCRSQKGQVLSRLVSLLMGSPRFAQRWCWRCYSWYLQYVQLKGVVMAQRYRNQVVFKPSQKLQTGDIQPRHGDFYKVT